MHTEDFLSRVLGSDGYYCLFSFRTKDDRRTQKFYTSVGEMADAARELDNKGYDAYFALATFEENNSRKVNNVKQLKSFFLDLDCGETKTIRIKMKPSKHCRVFVRHYHCLSPS